MPVIENHEVISCIKKLKNRFSTISAAILHTVPPSIERFTSLMITVFAIA